MMSSHHNISSIHLSAAQQNKNHPLPQTHRNMIGPSQSSTKHQQPQIRQQPSSSSSSPPPPPQQQQQQKEQSNTTVSKSTAITLPPKTQTHLDSSSASNELELVKQSTTNKPQSTVIMPPPPPPLPMIECTGCHRLLQVTLYMKTNKYISHINNVVQTLDNITNKTQLEYVNENIDVKRCFNVVADQRSRCTVSHSIYNQYITKIGKHYKTLKRSYLIVIVINTFTLLYFFYFMFIAFFVMFDDGYAVNINLTSISNKKNATYIQTQCKRNVNVTEKLYIQITFIFFSYIDISTIKQP